VLRFWDVRKGLAVRKGQAVGKGLAVAIKYLDRG